MSAVPTRSVVAIYTDGRYRCTVPEEDVELAGLYFRDHKFSTQDAARALYEDDHRGKTHGLYDWLAIVHEAKARIDRDLDFRGVR